LNFEQRRFANGNNWNNAETRIQNITDSTRQAYVSFNPDGEGGMSFGTGSPSTEKLRILSNGNVGIGTTNPAEKLTVVGNLSASGNVSASGVSAS
jgi:hypothetical protein